MEPKSATERRDGAKRAKMKTKTKKENMPLEMSNDGDVQVFLFVSFITGWVDRYR